VHSRSAEGVRPAPRHRTIRFACAAFGIAILTLLIAAASVFTGSMGGTRGPETAVVVFVAACALAAYGTAQAAQGRRWRYPFLSRRQRDGMAVAWKLPNPTDPPR